MSKTIEKIVYLDTVEPISIFGVNNVKLKKIKQCFPKIKIIARGNELKAIGEELEIKNFEQKVHLFIEHFHEFNTLTEKNIDDLMHPPRNGEDVSAAKQEGVLIFGTNGKHIKPQTPHQHEMVNKSDTNDLLFAVGPAGTGKTYIAIALAVKALRNKQVKRIILTRPAVEAGERLGFLPGDMKEKLDPYLQPLYDALFDMIPARKLEDLIKENIIQIAPLAFMRGRTLSNAYVILDEAQNATLNQLKMFLTRMGLHSKFIVTGDLTQIDLPRKEQSGLLQSKRILKDIAGVEVIRFDSNDIVRHSLVKQIVDAYDVFTTQPRDKKKNV